MRIRILALCAAALFLAACSQENNLLMGRVEAAAGTHRVVVTDCYRTSAPGPEIVEGGDVPLHALQGRRCLDP